MPIYVSVTSVFVCRLLFEYNPSMLFKAISGGSACLTAGRTVRAACRFRILRYESGGKQKTKSKSVFRLVDKTAGNGSANMGSNPIAQS